MQPTEVAQMELRDLRFRVWRLVFFVESSVASASGYGLRKPKGWGVGFWV